MIFIHARPELVFLTSIELVESATLVEGLFIISSKGYYEQKGTSLLDST
jgi:hypothetical protein